MRESTTARTPPHDTARQLEIDGLIEAEAALQQQLDAARAEAAAWRSVAKGAIEALRQATTDHDHTTDEAAS
jgi:hypothetical protein